MSKKMNPPKVLFCQFDSLEYYSYMILSAKLYESGIVHEVEIIEDDMAFCEKLAHQFSDYKIIGFFCANSDFERIMRLSRKIKSVFQDRLIVLGGPHPTLNPETIDFGIIDFVCIGAGEFHFARWVSEGHWNIRENYKNMACDLSKPYEVLFVSDLDKSPKPNRDVYYKKYDFMKNMGMRRFLFSSGCPYSCTYCHNVNFRTKFKDCYPKAVLFKNPAMAIAEMKETLEKYPSDGIAFLDDNFCINKKWLFEFLDLYHKNIHRPFNMFSSINTLTDEVIERLCDSGLKILRVAMETTNEDIRTRILNRPKYSNEKFAEVAKKLNKHGIRVIMLNMFCLPGQTLADCVEAFRFAKKNGVLMYISILVPFKGTEICRHCIDNDLLIDPDVTQEMLGKPSLKGEEMERMVTLQNFSFLLNHLNIFISPVLFLSRYKWFREFAYRYISPINLVLMHLPIYLGLFSLKKYITLGIRNYRTVKRKQ